MIPLPHEFHSLNSAVSPHAWAPSVPAVEAAAWFLIVLLFGLLAAVLFFITLMKKRSAQYAATHPDAASIPAGASRASEAPRQPWERDADWWKNQS